MCFSPEHAAFIWQPICSAASPSPCFMSHFCTFSMKWDIFGCGPGIETPWDQVGREFPCVTSAQGHLVQPLAFDRGQTPLLLPGDWESRVRAALSARNPGMRLKNNKKRKSLRSSGDFCGAGSQQSRCLAEGRQNGAVFLGWPLLPLRVPLPGRMLGDKRGQQGHCSLPAGSQLCCHSGRAGSGSETTFPRCKPVGCCFSLWVLAQRGWRFEEQARKRMLELLRWEVKFPKMALWWLFRSCHCQQKGGEKKKTKTKTFLDNVGLRGANI